MQGCVNTKIHHDCSIIVGREQTQRGDRGREDVQPVVAHATSRGSDARIRGAAKSQTRKYCQTFGHRRRARRPGKGHCHGTLYR